MQIELRKTRNAKSRKRRATRDIPAGKFRVYFQVEVLNMACAADGIDSRTGEGVDVGEGPPVGAKVR